MRHYLALIRKDKDSDYGVDFPDFPGCVTAGETIDEAKDMAWEALEGHIQLVLEEGERLPEPSSLEAVMSHPDHADAVAFLVEVRTPTKAVRINITMDENLLRDIDAKSRELGKSRSAFLADAARVAL